DRGDAAGAEAEFRYVLTLDPQNLIALKTLGELAQAGRRVDEARRWYEELLKVDPMNEEARRALDGLRSMPAQPEAPPPAGIETTAAPGWEEPEAPQPAARPVPGLDVSYGGAVELRDDEEGLPFEVEEQAVVTETIAELY